jgi:hypothetical protein
VISGVAVVVSLTIASGLAYAVIPASDGTVQACYTKVGGIIRVVDDASKCSKTLETPISWNQRGQQGAPGQQGEAGKQGERGAVGPSGAQGPPGPDGATGHDGVSGYEVVQDDTAMSDVAQSGLVVSCSPGKKVVAGGFSVGVTSLPIPLVSVTTNGPNSLGTGWVVEAWRESGQAGIKWFLRVYAVCADVMP